jgi:hypothetical protein
VPDIGSLSEISGEKRKFPPSIFSKPRNQVNPSSQRAATAFLTASAKDEF